MAQPVTGARLKRQKRAVNLNESIRDIEAMLRRLIGENVTVLLNLDPDLQPGRAREAGITEYNKYIVEIDGRREVIDNLNEIPLTTAISEVCRSAVGFQLSVPITVKPGTMRSRCHRLMIARANSGSSLRIRTEGFITGALIDQPPLRTFPLPAAIGSVAST